MPDACGAFGRLGDLERGGGPAGNVAAPSSKRLGCWCVCWVGRFIELPRSNRSFGGAGQGGQQACVLGSSIADEGCRGIITTSSRRPPSCEGPPNELIRSFIHRCHGARKLGWALGAVGGQAHVVGGRGQWSFFECWERGGAGVGMKA